MSTLPSPIALPDPSKPQQWSPNLDIHSRTWETPTDSFWIFVANILQNATNAPVFKKWQAQCTQLFPQAPIIGPATIATAVLFAAAKISSLALPILLGIGIAYGVLCLYFKWNPPSVTIYRGNDFISDKTKKKHYNFLASSNLYNPFLSRTEITSRLPTYALLVVDKPSDNPAALQYSALLLIGEDGAFFGRKMAETEDQDVSDSARHLILFRMRDMESSAVPLESDIVQEGAKKLVSAQRTTLLKTFKTQYQAFRNDLLAAPSSESSSTLPAEATRFMSTLRTRTSDGVNYLRRLTGF